MKKALCSLLSVMMLGSVLVGCGGKKEAAPAPSTAKPAATQEVKAKPEYTTVEALAYTALYDVLKKNGISVSPTSNGKVAATSYGHSDKGFIALIKGGIYVVNLQNNTYGYIEYTDYLDKMYQDKNKKEGGLATFIMMHSSKKADKDQKLGKWVNDTHYIPYYVLYDHDKAGNPVPEERIFSASGTLQPSHYHDNVVEPDNIALASLAVTEAYAYMDNAKKNGIAYGESGEGTITGTEVLFRKGPGKNHDVIGSFEKGEKVTILEEGTGWYKVRRKTNEVGWVSADFCSK